MRFPEQFRISRPGMGPYQSKAGDTFGMFIVPAFNAPKRRRLRIMASDGNPNGEDGCPDVGWEHVSVSTDSGAIPTWEEMCLVKDLFWDDSQCVVQFHPAKSNYVNIHKGCLHLWRCRTQEFPMPPEICV